MKIIHCADIHLDANITNPDASVKQRNHEIRNTMIRMFDFAAANKVNAIIIAGDLLDSDLISEETRSVLLTNIRKYNDIHFYYLRGNHDKDNLLTKKQESPTNLHTFSENLKIYKTMLRNGRYISISGLETQEMDSNQVSARIKLDARDFNIVCLHGQLKEYAQSGKCGEFGLHRLEHKHIHYLALGHVHKFQKGTLAPNGMYAYPGCLEGRGFDDAGEHGFILLDINEDNFSYRFQFVRFAGRKVGKISLDVTDLFTYDEVLRAVLEMAHKAGIKSGDHLKVDLKGESFAHRMELDYLEEDLKKHFFRVKVNNRIQKSEIFADYRYDPSFRGEFCRAVDADLSMEDSMKRKIMECGIKFLNEEY